LIVLSAAYQARAATAIELATSLADNEKALWIELIECDRLSEKSL
jgi:hypothetical protein